MIDKNSPVPLYDQLVDILIKKIKTELSANDKMLSERLICQKYEVSRTTVRQALGELEKLGYIYKRTGKGTYVTGISQEKQNLMDNYSFTEQMKQMGKTPTTKVLFFKIIESNQYLSEKMGIELGAQVYRLTRLRIADDVPMMLETSHIPVKNFEGLTKDLVEVKPLYEIFKEYYNQTVKLASEEFSASLVADEASEMLEVEEGSPCLRLSRLSYNHLNEVIEFTVSIARSDQFIYKVNYTR